MYIEKRKTNGKIKYYLAHSFREGKKIHKIRKYLGRNPKGDLLNERIKIAKQLILEEINQYKIIKDPLQTPLSKRDIKLVENLEKTQKLKILHLSEKQWELFSKVFIYNTNAIEGSEINKEEVEEILKESEWPEKSKEDIAEVYGVDNAIKFIRKTKEHLSLNLIKDLHKIIFKNSKGFAGKFRKKGEEVVVMNGLKEVIHHGAPQSRIIYLLNELINWYNKNKHKYPTLILASVVHNQFENIHPFKDGNGRVGRLLLNNILIKHKLPPINIDLKNSEYYYKTLLEYEKNNNLKPTINLLLKEYKNLKRIISKKAKVEKLK